ncbi:peptide ABC transporter permease, partial [Streptomyces sp. ZEA17I]
MSDALLVQEAGAAPAVAPAPGARSFRQRLRAQRAASAAALVV